MEIPKIEEFDGEILHPSLDIKNGILTIGFRYRVNQNEERELFLIVKDGGIIPLIDNFFEHNGKRYFIKNDKRKLIRIEERWSIAELNKFLDEYANVKSASFVNPKAIFEKIRGLIKKYVELEKDEDYSILTAWGIGTYFFPIFSAYPFLNIKAPKKSGKSQCLNLLNQICFNGTKARPTLAALGDSVDSLRGTYLIDQADSLERKEGEELLDILTDSYKKTGGKRRVLNFNKNKSREVLEFETYSPKVFASIRELSEDLRDRCFIVPLVRSQKNFPSPDDESDNWRLVRGELYKLLLTQYDLVANYYFVGKAGYRAQTDIIGRELELWLPLEIILKSCDMENEIEQNKKRFLSQYGFAEYEPSEIEEATIKATLNLIKDASEAVLTPIEISQLIDQDLFQPAETPNQKAARVGWAIKKFNLSSKKMPRTKGGVRYLFEKNKVEGVYRSYLKTNEEPTPLTPDNANSQISEQLFT